MRYSKEQIAQLDEELTRCLKGLFELQSACIEQARLTKNEKATEYLSHGVNRRLITIRHALAKIFMSMPPDLKTPASRESVLDAQVNLHAFLISVVGIFDNLAWAYAHHHNLHDLLRRKQSIDLFKAKTQAHLPPEIVSYLASDATKIWYQDHFKNYRDALAHRIPPYIPSAFVKQEDSKLYQQLSTRKVMAQVEDDRSAVDSISDQIHRLEQPNLMYMQSFDPSEGSRPVLLHPQVLCDSSTICEFGGLFLKHWLPI